LSAVNAARFQAITGRYVKLRIAVIGDFCLDRYLEIDPDKKETSLETGLPVHNVVRVRAQPGGAGTIVNNLAALGVGTVDPVGFAGNDGEGFELCRALAALPGVSLKHFFATPYRRTFTYTKPLLQRRGRPPCELNRLDLKNWTPTPPPVQQRLADSLCALGPRVDAVIVLDQAPVARAGVVTGAVLQFLRALAGRRRVPLILADSRRGLRGFPPVMFKMNRAELQAFVGSKRKLSLAEVRKIALVVARQNRQPVFVTLAERGILGASPDGSAEMVAALPLRGPIDIVGAGDAVTANLAAALAAGATLREALELANAAASVVIHQLGTTGTATVKQIGAWLATT
jgi:rfaE bifunctional protein kinase chain/domain